jgi:hypothetical protein
VQVYLHVGAGKTGTSAIQAGLARHRTRLAELGVWYPLPMPGFGSDMRAVQGHVTSGNAVALGRLIRFQTGARDMDLARVGPWLDECMAQAGGRPIVFSSEMMQVPSRPELDELTAYFARRGCTVKVVYYVRHLLEHSVSAYQQFLKIGRSARASLGDYLSGFRTDLPRLLGVFADAVGPENLICRLYDDDKEDLLSNFLSSISEPAARSPDIKPVDTIINRSPTSVEMRLYETLNREQDSESICRLMTDMLMNSAPQGVSPLTICKDVFERFSENNATRVEAINRHFLRNGQRLLLTSGTVKVVDEAPVLAADEVLATLANCVATLARGLIAQRNAGRMGQPEEPDASSAASESEVEAGLADPDEEKPHRPLAAMRRARKGLPMDADAAESYVLDLYEHLLRRKPNAAELARWVAVLQREGSAHALFKRFVASPEYRAKNTAVPTRFPPGHYHSPVVDPETVKDYVAVSSMLRPGDIAGIKISAEGMLQFWRENLDFIRCTPFPEAPTPQYRFRYEGSPYPYGDAIMLRAMLRAKHPARVVEIGSGFSTACMLDSADEIGLSDLAITCIEPYPERLKSLAREGDFKRITLIEQPVQKVSLDVFRQLKAGDILLIDSTHVLKTGSDVHYELFSVLPSLAPGVVVHFHDCQYPFEYPGKWIFELNYSWNEVYAVRAFLMYNDRFRVLFWNSFFARRFRKEAAQDYPTFLKNSGSSLWIEAS